MASPAQQRRLLEALGMVDPIDPAPDEDQEPKTVDFDGGVRETVPLEPEDQYQAHNETLLAMVREPWRFGSDG